MKKITLLSIALFTLVFSGFCPLQTRGLYSDKQIESFVRAVFADQADALVFKSESPRLALITDFLNRVEVVHRPDLAGKKIKPLSGIPLQDKYNPALQRDLVYDPGTFNPLKYQLPMASKSKETYRFGQTDYLIVIHPVK